MAAKRSAKIDIETPERIEPAMLETLPPSITDVMAELSAESAALGKRLHPKTAASLADLVRIMNAYYSNLIEGHNTRPKDIARALEGDLDENEGRRNLQLEAASHVRLQEKIDRLAAASKLPEPASVDFLKWLHAEFYRDVPEALLHIRKNEATYVMRPGEWRSNPADDVVVGRHQPPSSAHVEEFMTYFQNRYKFVDLGKSSRIVAMAASHHRLNYIHPFPDGNGRVSRLMSHAMGHAAGVGAHGLWSASRGLARGLESRTDYKRMMDFADSPRENDLDGRGNLSQRALAEFVLWFLRVCLDQVRFMSGLFELDTLVRRLRAVAERHFEMRAEAARLLEEAAIRGEFDRGETGRITGLSERSARRVLNEVINKGLLGSDTPKGPVSIRFTPEAAEIVFPRLFPAT